MTKFILIIGVLLASLESDAQNAKEILQKSFSKCLSIKNGYYDMEMRMKFMDEKETHDYGRYKVYFNRLKNDSLSDVLFNSEQLSKGEYFKNTMYSGKEYITYSKTDSSAEIMSKNKWTSTIKKRLDYDNFKSYLPFTSKDCSPFPKASDYTDTRHFFKFINKEIQNNIHSYHIQMIEYPKYESTKILYVIETVYDFWINSKDMVPIKYSASSKVLNNGDTLIAYTSRSLNKYNLNVPPDENLKQLQLSSIPKYCVLKNYVENSKVELLSKDSNSPNWALKSLEGQSVSLSDYDGKVILIDFFYKNCLPCMKAVPMLKSLNEKYKSKGLVVIGIDPIDTDNDEIKTFISKNGITYKIVVDENKDVATKYKISVYPTVYLINRNGKIIFAASDYDEALEGKLEELLKGNL